jgi:hypothetical protein
MLLRWKRRQNPAIVVEFQVPYLTLCCVWETKACPNSLIHTSKGLLHVAITILCLAGAL